VNKPWDPIPGDDGYEWSLRVTRWVCAGWLLFPLLFWLGDWAIMLTGGRPHEEPLIVAALAILAVMIVPAAPFVRERVAHIGIGVHLEGERPWTRHRPVYGTFATATITSFIIAQAPALFGFIATAMTRDYLWLMIGSAISYAAWALLWPRRLLWARWSWQARIDREDETARIEEPEPVEPDEDDPADAGPVDAPHEGTAS
jgi:hypothetical protein